MADAELQQRFEGLLAKHQRIVFKVARVYAHTVHDRDDLAQEIVLQLWRSFRTFDAGRARFSTWTYRVALNVAISWMRAAQRHGAGWLEPLDDGHAETAASTHVPHDEALEQNQRRAALNAFIGGLDPLNRALVMLYLDDCDYAEIAEVLGISETNVATKLNRIKQKLRAQANAAQATGADHGTR